MIALSQQVRRAFFSRHGGRPRPFQDKAFELLSIDRDGLLSAPTGVGKTEAALAPVAQNLLEHAFERGRLRGLIVSPTRALASDLYKRMSPIFRELGLRLDVATSDKNTVGRVPSDILIRTPEGLDIDIGRRSSKFSSIQDVVIDELHVFLDNARGTQLSGLMARLTEVSPTHRRLGLSATIPDLRKPAQSGLLRDPIVVEPESDESKGIETLYYDWVGSPEQAATGFVQAMRQLGVKKAIGFASRKRRVEDLSKLLDRGYFRGKCFPHHGDLSSSGRRRVEAQLRDMPVALVIATTTLEVGIDVGTVDTCILFDAPDSFESFMQRAGRSGRRSGKRRVVCVSGLFGSRIDFVRVVASGPTKPPERFKPFLAGCLQQILSYAVQEKGLSLDRVRAFAATAFGMQARVVDVLLVELVRHGWLERSGDSVEPSTKLLQLGETNLLHVTFAPTFGASVVDETSGKRIGRAPVSHGDEIVLGGKGRRVQRIDPITGIATVKSIDGGFAQFGISGKSIFEQLAEKYESLVGSGYR